MEVLAMLFYILLAIAEEFGKAVEMVYIHKLIVVAYPKQISLQLIPIRN